MSSSALRPISGISDETWAELEKAADELGESRSSLIRGMIDDYLEDWRSAYRRSRLTIDQMVEGAMAAAVGTGPTGEVHLLPDDSFLQTSEPLESPPEGALSLLVRAEEPGAHPQEDRISLSVYVHMAERRLVPADVPATDAVRVGKEGVMLTVPELIG